MPPIGLDVSDDLDVDLLVVEFAGAQLLAEGIARRRRGGLADERVQNPVLGALMGLGLHLFALLLAHQPDADLDEVADDLLDVAADIADLGELGRLDLDEGRAGEPRQAARDLGLADARGSDHQDVLRHHLFAQASLELLAPPAVAQRDGDGALGVLLADDVAVELGDDLAGGEIGHHCLLRECPTATTAGSVERARRERTAPAAHGAQTGGRAGAPAARLPSGDGSSRVEAG